MKMTLKPDSSTDLPPTSTPFPVLGGESVFDRIIENFKQGLIQGTIRPGQRLPSELELAEQMRVGRSAIREAFKVLAALGVIAIRRGDGTYVVDKPSDQLLSPLVFSILLEGGMTTELVELRALIEVGYAQLAAQKMTDADWKRIQSAEQALEDAARAGVRDPDELTRLDLNFHFALIEATHNPLVIRISRAVEELFFGSIRETQVAQPATAIEGHRRVLGALESQDAEAIREAIVASLAHWRLIVEVGPVAE